MTSKTALAADAIKRYPDKTSREIAALIGVSHMTVNRARSAGKATGAAAPTGEPPHRWPLDDLLAALDGALDEAIGQDEAPVFTPAVLSSVIRKAEALRTMTIDSQLGRSKRTVQQRG
jgi:hypothetical protein